MADHVPGPALGADRVALVTGASRGIGRAVARRISREGCRVALTARSADQLAETAAECEGETLQIAADMLDPQAPDDVVRRVGDAWGRIDVVVANAGAGTSARIEKTTDEQWQRMLDINLTAPFRLLRAVIPSMRDAGHGRIVVIASVSARIGQPYIGAYTASKHGVLGLVRTAAVELAQTGVTVNAVCPGYVDTPMTDDTVAGIVAATGRSEREARELLRNKQPSGRLVRPDEVADAVWMCVTNGSINGQGINVDGGAVQS